ncbi:MAG: WD40 repeat domain-containing protein [Polyangiaceae bacterium]|jgi:WD40 repeat protein|nr:WD40 repeat domain-containing protein [Polyangiaceae bacterium]
MPGVKPTPGKTELPQLWSADLGDYVVRVAPLRDGAVAALTGGGKLVLLDPEGRPRWQAEGHGGGALALALCPSAPRIAVGGHDGKVHLYDLEGGQQVTTLEAGKGWVEQLAWSPDGGRIAASAGRVARVWSSQGQALLETDAHPSTITGLQWGARGVRLATCCYGGVRIWPLKAGIQAQHLAWKGSLISLAWSPDEKVVACGSQDGSVHFWRLPSGRDSEMSGYRFKPRALAWDSASSLLATSGDADICVWDFGGKGPEGTAPLQLEGHQGLCTELAFSPARALLASGGQDSGVLLWEPRKGLRPLRFAFLEDEVTCLRWSARGDALLGADARGTVRCWKTA